MKFGLHSLLFIQKPRIDAVEITPFAPDYFAAARVRMGAVLILIAWSASTLYAYPDYQKSMVKKTGRKVNCALILFFQ